MANPGTLESLKRESIQGLLETFDVVSREIGQSQLRAVVRDAGEDTATMPTEIATGVW